MDHATILNSYDAKAERVGFGKLKASEKIVVLVSRANFEIENGGLSQFFYNSTRKRANNFIGRLGDWEWPEGDQ